MLILLSLVLLLSGCDKQHFTPNFTPTSTQTNLLEPYQPTEPSDFQKSQIQTVIEPSIGAGMFLVGAIAFFSLKRK